MGGEDDDKGSSCKSHTHSGAEDSAEPRQAATCDTIAKKETMHKVSPRGSWAKVGDDFLASRLEKDFSQL